MTGSSSSSFPLSRSCRDSQDRALLPRVAAELEALRCVPLHDGADFPMSCRSMLYALPGNAFCVDCGSPGPEWCSVSYGVLLCVQCSGRHRSYGVQTSFVRSIAMDAWSHAQVLAMLEGGNQQLHSFFERHQMGTTLEAAKRNSSSTDRYHTKAALFYSSNLKMHAQDVAESGSYRGRESTRQPQKQQQQQQPQRHDVMDQPLECDQRQPITVGN